MRILVRLIFLAALATWAWGVVLVITGSTERGLAIGVPSAFILLLYAWRKTGYPWLPDGGGGP